MSPKVEKPTPPSAQNYADAFYMMEGRLNHVESLLKVAEYLAGILMDRATDEKNPNDEFFGLAEATARSVFHAVDGMKEADAAFYEAFNDLVGRENAAAKAVRP